MTIAKVNEPIRLGITLVKNNQLKTGQSVQVKVVSLNDGATLLATTSVPETIHAGVYSVIWTPPAVKQEVVAIYTVNGVFIFAEPIQVISEPFNDCGLEAYLIDDSELSGFISDDLELTGAVDDGDLSAFIDDADSFSGTIDQDELSGSIDQC